MKYPPAMSRAELTTELSNWIGEITESPAPVLTDATDLARDLGLDSLSIAELAARVRQRLQIRLRASDVVQDLSVGHLLDLVEQQRK